MMRFVPRRIAHQVQAGRASLRRSYVRCMAWEKPGSCGKMSGKPASAGRMLDINLGDGETSFPVAEELSCRSVRFVFLTGYGEPCVSGKFPGRPMICKPVEETARADPAGVPLKFRRYPEFSFCGDDPRAFRGLTDGLEMVRGPPSTRWEDCCLNSHQAQSLVSQCMRLATALIAAGSAIKRGRKVYH